VILSGILHTSLGGFMVIRGVAPLGDLARCSCSDSAYQRNLIEIHRSEIGFNLQHWQQVRFSGTLELKEKLVHSLVQHFQLGASTQ